MSDPFEALGERLLRAGVAPREVRTYLVELHDHAADLAAEEEASGLAPAVARTRAVQRLGDLETLAQAMTANGASRAWSVRAPAIAYLVAPAAGIAAAFAVSICTMMAIVKTRPIGLGGHPVLPVWFGGLAHGLSGLDTIVVPVLLAWMIVASANAQRARPFWPVLGVIALAVIGGAADLEVTLPTGRGGRGEINIGSGFLPPFTHAGPTSLHLIANLAAMLGLYLVFAHRRRLRVALGQGR